eukprot:TRINITY_DN32459_c0_g1_i1.p1 TRINITY_DN32459_c0_g1~~TRINITY_DN32459_c0_g1_i1.p1  ORF type:complete len:654 (+),score=106.82 TRINITY_DN32459_c0_g1_i1:39-1964(+)
MAARPRLSISACGKSVADVAPRRRSSVARKSVAAQPVDVIDDVPLLIRRQIISAARHYLAEKRQAAIARQEDLDKQSFVKAVFTVSRRTSRALRVIKHLRENVEEQKSWREERSKRAGGWPVEQSAMLKEACILAAQLNELSNKDESKEQVADIVASINKCIGFLQELQKAGAAEGAWLAEATDLFSMAEGTALSSAFLLELQKEIARMQEAIERSRAAVEAVPQVMLDMDEIVKSLSFKVVHMIKSSTWLRGAKADAHRKMEEGDEDVDDDDDGEEEDADLNLLARISENEGNHLAEISGQETSKDPTLEPHPLIDSNQENAEPNNLIGSPSQHHVHLAESHGSIQALQPHAPIEPRRPDSARLATRQRLLERPHTDRKTCTPSELQQIGDEGTRDLLPAESGWNEASACESADSKHISSLLLFEPSQDEKLCCANAGITCADTVELQATGSQKSFFSGEGAAQADPEDLHDAAIPPLEQNVQRRSAMTVDSGSPELCDTTAALSHHHRPSSSKAEMRRNAAPVDRMASMSPARSKQSSSSPRAAWPHMEDLNCADWDVLESIVGKSKDRSGCQKNHPPLPSIRTTAVPSAAFRSAFSSSPPHSGRSSPRIGVCAPPPPASLLTLPKILSPSFHASPRRR